MPHLTHVVKPGAQRGRFIGCVDDREGPIVLGLGAVLKVGYIPAHHLPVDDEEALAVNHVRDHEHLQQQRQQQ
jgi:hypothetical protein